jgi:hypothetical protein
MGSSMLFADKIGSGHRMMLGYTIMVASFLLVYFGIRSYRDNTLAGQISFSHVFARGILIILINMGYTFMEPLPVGLVITLTSAVLLRRKAPAPSNSSVDAALA